MTTLLPLFIIPPFTIALLFLIGFYCAPHSLSKFILTDKAIYDVTIHNREASGRRIPLEAIRAVNASQVKQGYWCSCYNVKCYHHILFVVTIGTPHGIVTDGHIMHLLDDSVPFIQALQSVVPDLPYTTEEINHFIRHMSDFSANDAAAV